MALLVVLSGCSALPGSAQQSLGQHGVDITASGAEINVGDQVTITFSASGEVGSYDTGYLWSGGKTASISR